MNLQRLPLQLLTFLVALTYSALGFGQNVQLFGCDEIPANAQAAAACSICNFDTGLGTTIGYTPSDPAGWCGTIENDQYIGFLAGPTGAVSFELSAFNCDSPDGLQVGIYDLSNTLVGDCFNQIVNGASQVFSAGGLTPGETYFIRIDGFAGTACDFTITVISGIVAQPSPVIDTIEGPQQVCFDHPYEFSVDTPQVGVNYLWTVTPGQSVQDFSLADSSLLIAPYGGGSTLAITFNSVGSSLQPGQCDTVNISAVPINICFPQDTATHITVNVCRPLMQDTIQVVVQAPVCSTRYTDSITQQSFGIGTHYFLKRDSHQQVQCDTLIELVVMPGTVIEPNLSGPLLLCDSISSLTSSPSGGAPPYTFDWSTGVRETGLTSTLNISQGGTYFLVITDQDGCRRNASYRVVESSASNIPLTFVGTDCNGDGGFVSLDSLLTTQVDVTWSTGATNVQSIGPLPAGRYSVSLSDPASGCVVDSIFYIRRDPACYSTIGGYVVIDTATNCQSYLNHFPLQNIPVTCSNGMTVFTDSSGYYEFRVDTGTYTVQVLPGATSWTPACTQVYTFDVTSYQQIYPLSNFFFTGQNLFDISLVLTKNSPSVGRVSQVYIEVCNNSALPASFEVTLEFGEQQTFISGYPRAIPQAVGDSTVIFTFVDLQPFECVNLRSCIRTSQSATVGDSITYTAYTDAATTNTDVVPGDNFQSCTTAIIGSYDPNDKTPTPAGTGPEGFISTSDSLMRYTIRFQNTGSDDALYVRLEDAISDKLDITTLKPVGASHPYEAFYNEDNRLFVTFDPIVLPPEAQDTVGSQGYFTYTIQTMPGLQPGDVINNTAEIYFDFNDPIITNTTVNTIESPVSTRSPQVSRELMLYPNPTTGELTLRVAANQQIERVGIVSIDGRVVRHLAYTQAGRDAKLDLGELGLAHGIYNLQVTLADGELLSKRVVLQR